MSQEKPFFSHSIKCDIRYVLSDLTLDRKNPKSIRYIAWTIYPLVKTRIFLSAYSCRFDIPANEKLQTLCILFSVPQLHKCNRSQELPQLAKCLERSIESVQYYLKKNIITSLVGPYHKKDNYMFSKMRHFFGVLSLYDIKIQGLTNYNISNLW